MLRHGNTEFDLKNVNTETKGIMSAGPALTVTNQAQNLVANQQSACVVNSKLPLQLLTLIDAYLE